jgi:hypothetical protein
MNDQDYEDELEWESEKKAEPQAAPIDYAMGVVQMLTENNEAVPLAVQEAVHNYIKWYFEVSKTPFHN